MCLVYGLKPVEYVTRYDDQCRIGSNKQSSEYLRENALNDDALTCNITVTVTEDLQPPIYVWYQIDGLYQNHRRCAASPPAVTLSSNTTAARSNLLVSQCLGMCAGWHWLLHFVAASIEFLHV